MDESRLKLYRQVLRMVKGIVKAFEEWIEAEASKK